MSYSPNLPLSNPYKNPLNNALYNPLSEVRTVAHICPHDSPHIHSPTPHEHQQDERSLGDQGCGATGFGCGRVAFRVSDLGSSACCSMYGGALPSYMLRIFLWPQSAGLVSTCIHMPVQPSTMRRPESPTSLS